MIITKIVYPLLKSAIISWNLLGYFCESWDMTLRICFLMQGLHGAGHLPANTSGARILICLPMSSQGPLLDAQSIWNLIKSSSLSLSSVMRFVAAQETPLATPLATFWTPLTTVSRIPPCCFAGAGLLCWGRGCWGWSGLLCWGSGRGGGGAPLTPKRAFAGAPPRYAPWGWGGGTAPRYGGGGPLSLFSWTGYCCWSTRRLMFSGVWYCCLGSCGGSSGALWSWATSLLLLLFPLMTASQASGLSLWGMALVLVLAHIEISAIMAHLDKPIIFDVFKHVDVGTNANNSAQINIYTLN